jgi:altronate hydrolase
MIGIRLADVALHLHPDDPLAVAKVLLAKGTTILLPDGQTIVVKDNIPAGHKLALRNLRAGEPVLRYGQFIGQASAEIQAGEWVHTHNLTAGEISARGSLKVVPALEMHPSGRTFRGYRRADGSSTGTRNLVAVVAASTCAAHAASQIARQFGSQSLAAYPNVDGVVAVVHPGGCSIPPEGLSQRYLRRALANLGRHPNLGGVLYIGLGCEVNQVADCLPPLDEEAWGRLPGSSLVIQESGGFEGAVQKGAALVEELLAQANTCAREEVPLSQLTLALQCGGSDSWSGVTANPLVGRVADRVVREGGTAVLAETTELFGAEHLLAERVVSEEVGRKLFERCGWWLEQATARGFSIDNNPTPGNKAGGLTTILEKSLGALAKGGSTPLNGVYEYGEWIDRRGLVLMDTPGNDPVSITGQIAGGCTLILFTTGRGSVYGSSLAPCIKIASNSELARRMPGDMDFDAGRLLAGLDWEQATEELLAQIIAAASGELTKSERHGRSEAEFVPWQPDAVL